MTSLKLRIPVHLDTDQIFTVLGAKSRLEAYLGADDAEKALFAGKVWIDTLPEMYSNYGRDVECHNVRINADMIVVFIHEVDDNFAVRGIAYLDGRQHAYAHPWHL